MTEKEIGVTYYYSKCPYCGQWFDDRFVDINAHMALCPSAPLTPPPEELPKACIIATVFLGEQHRLLAPMRKFRDKFIPKSVMNIYYCVSVYVLRKLRKLR